MKILGIDPALGITGFGLIEKKNTQLSLVSAGVIKTSIKKDLAQRLLHIFTSVEMLIRDCAPDTVVLEKVYAHYRHPATAYVLGHARGAICLAAAAHGVPVVEYAATHVKKAIAGRGMASKQQIQRMVAMLLDMKQLPKYSDVTDALALAIAFAHAGNARTFKRRR